MPGALSELVNIKRVDGSEYPDVSAEETFTVKSERSSTFLVDIGGPLAEMVTVVPGDIVNFTLTVKNTGSEAGVLNPYSYWRSSRWDFVDWVTEPVEWYHGDQAGCTDGCEYLDMYVYLAPGETATYEYQAQKLPFGVSYSVAYVHNLVTFLAVGSYPQISVYSYAGGIPLDFTSFFYDDMTDRSLKDGPEAVAPGENLTYDIYLHNPSSYDAPVYVEDFLPKGVEFESYAPSAGCTNSQTGFEPLTNKFWWSGFVSTAGCDLTLNTVADGDLVEGQVLLNEASLSDKFQGTPFGWLSKTTTVDEGVDLVLNKSVDKLVGFWGDFLTYEITLTNNGEYAHNAYVEDKLPADVAMWPNTLTADSGSVTFDADTNTVHWVGNLDTGQEVVITFKVRVVTGTPTGKIMLNAATAGAENWNSVVYSSAVTEELVNLWYLPAVLNGMAPTP